MNFKKIGFVILLISCLLPVNQLNAQTENVGFIPSNIWYSKDPFEEGDKIKIYTVIFNPENKELSGTVSFYDKTTLLGDRKFSAPPNSVKDISINWVVSAGEHKIFAKIENAKFASLGGEYDDVILENSKTEESVRTVNKKIVVESDPDKTNNRGFPINQISNIQNLINEGTPDFIAEPLVLGAETVEEFRSDLAESSQDKKEEIKKELDALNNKSASSKAKVEDNKILKPWKYVEYFLMALLSFILNNKIIFYSISGISTFLLLRFIWRKIF